MVKKIFITILLFISTSTYSLYADVEVSSVAKNWFNNYSKKISIKYNDEQEILFFEGFSDKLNDIIAKKTFNENQKNLINDLIKLSNEYIFKLELNKKETENKYVLNSNPILNDFKYLSYNEDHIFIENGIWYAYLYDKHLRFPDGTTISKKDFEYNGIKTESTIVFVKEDKSLGFIVNYKKVKLISDSIIYGISNKYNFIKEIKDDKKILDIDTDDLFKKLKNDTFNITNGKIQSLKIKNIYNFVLNNIDYPKSFSLADPKIFSGIDTYQNKSGVCEGYTKMFMYMLNFSGINNTEVIRGYVLDAPDFPKVGHAWVKIGNYYFDTTFDDPIGNKETKKYENYLFYGLPKDLFYTNRYELTEIPEYIKEKDIDFRKDLITKNVSLLINKYKSSGLNLLKQYMIKVNNGIELNKRLDINDLNNIMGSYEVINFNFTEKGSRKTISNLKYYVLDDEKIEEVLSQIQYNFDGYYLFKWKLDNGTYEYRLAYNVEVK